MPKVKEELKWMEEGQKKDERVTGPTDCCAPMVPVQKSNGKLRICLDLRRLTSAVKRSLDLYCLLWKILHPNSLMPITFLNSMRPVDFGTSPYIQIVPN